MSFWADYKNLNDRCWPGRGPAYNFLKFNNIMPDGISLSISDSGQSHVARRRVYEHFDSESHRVEAIIANTDFSVSSYKSEAITRLLLISSVCYGLTSLDIAPDQILFPAGLYSSQTERRAAQGYFRPLEPEELETKSAMVQRFSAFIMRNCKGALHGMYCFDDAKINEFWDDVELLLNEGKIRDRLSYKRDSPALLSAKVRALLECTIQPDRLTG